MMIGMAHSKFGDNGCSRAFIISSGKKDYAVRVDVSVLNVTISMSPRGLSFKFALVALPVALGGVNSLTTPCAVSSSGI